MLLTNTSLGLYCPQADVYIDPWRAVPKAIITHAHSDHARTGSSYYLAHTQSENILRQRLGKNINVETIDYGITKTINGVKISLHPAGHIIGSAQIRLEYNNETWVVSGDYKVATDGLTIPFEPIKCSHFITESTFGLPIYDFAKAEDDYKKVCDWILENESDKINSVLIGYSLGKAQRILHCIKNIGIPIVVHGAVYEANEALGFSNENIIKYNKNLDKEIFKNCILVMPPGANEGAWLNAFGDYKTAVCSGWMAVRGWRRRGNADKGFAISDHADWKGLNEAVTATGAENIFITHGYKSAFAKFLRETKNLNAQELDTLFDSGE
jgi:putative mRNA 3-end processing factor